MEFLQRARSLGDEKRLVAAMLLKRRPEMCACEIQAALGISHATVNHHMNILLEAGIVTAQRRGKWMYYRLTPEGSRSLPRGD
ncbi:MAG: metalloregulator ArsR/SmtB family transcription factor [Thermoplasmata archaeon]